MKILRLHIGNEFRGLHKKFSLKFRNNSLYETDDQEPICLVGLNGSGKSNTLELLAELFYFLELRTITSKKKMPDLNDRFGFLAFELDYQITSLKWKSARSKTNEKVSIPENSSVVVKCLKKQGEDVLMTVYDKDQDRLGWVVPEELWKELLPDKVIGYSSGQNELISNPFIKLDYHYFDEFQKRARTSKDEVEFNTRLNRMFFMDYESNELIFLANYLFKEPIKVKSLEENDVNNRLKIERLHSFGLKFHFKSHNNQQVTLAPELNLGIEKLKRCATTWFDNEDTVKNKKQRAVRLNYFVDKGVRNAFKNEFKTSYELFRLFYLLRMMNIHSIGPKTRERVQDAPLGVNLSDLIPKPEMDRLVFKVDGIKLKKFHAIDPVWYKHLSDGEHQLLHVLGTLKMMQENDILFLLDEPETHFNPEWRAKMVRLILDTKEEEYYVPDHFITSHSPFIISDCKPTNVYLFKRDGKKVEVQTAHEMKFNTFGTSVNILTEEIFYKDESQGEYAGKKIKDLMEGEYESLKEIHDAKEEARVLGDSAEKVLLFRKFLMLEEKFNVQKIKKKRKKK